MNADQEQLAIDTCISAVNAYFPCEAIPPANHTCLCEQYTWHVACYDNHVSIPSLHSGRLNADATMQDECHAAGSVGAVMVQGRYNQERRQIGSFLNSIGGIVATFLSSKDITLPTALPSLPAASPARTTPPANPAASTASSNTASTPTTLTSVTSNASQSAAQSTASQDASSIPSKSSGPSIGLIAGAAIGGIAILLLIGILIMLVLRHKRKKRQTLARQSPNRSNRSLDETLVDRTPMTEHAVPVAAYVGNEKDVYRSDVVVPRGNEMATSANVWELDGQEMQRPSMTVSELESPGAERGRVRRQEHSELHF